MPAIASIYWWYIPRRLHNPLHRPPTTVGIYWWCIPCMTHLVD